MTKKTALLEIMWNGPFSWPKYENENNLHPIPKQSGVYLQTFEYNDGHIIYAAGITRRTIPTRFREHTHKYMHGDYNVLDVESIQNGIRKEIWHGWEYARQHRSEFEEKKSIILDAVIKQLAAFRIFIAHVGDKPRLLERLEASVMNHLYQQPSPFCDIPDKGMHLAPRKDSESPIIVKNMCSAVIHGLSSKFEI